MKDLLIAALAVALIVAIVGVATFFAGAWPAPTSDTARMWQDFSAFRAKLMASGAMPAYERKDGLDEVRRILEQQGADIGARFKKLDGRMDEIEKRMNRPQLGGGSAAPTDEQRAAFMGWLRNGDDRQLKAMSVGSDPDGGYTVVPQLADSIFTVMRVIDPLRDYARVVQITKSDAFEEVQDRAGTSGAEWVSETGTRGDTDTPQVAKLRIAAHEIFAQPKITQQLLDDSTYNLDSWLQQKIGQEFAYKTGNAYVVGDGVGKPRGFVTYPTAATADSSRAWGTLEHVATGTNASFGTGAAGAEKLIDLRQRLKPQYRKTAAWFMNRATAGSVRKLKDDSGRFVWQDSLQQDQPNLLLGHPVVELESMPDVGTGSLSIAIASMNPGYTVADRTPIRLLRDPYTQKPYVKFYTTFRAGGDVSDFHAIKFLKFAA